MNKTLAVLAASAALILGLTACGAVEVRPAPVETVTVTPDAAPAPAAPAPTSESAYLAVLQSQPFFQGIPEDTLIEAGESACSALDSGASVGAVVEVALASGIPEYEAGVLIGAAVAGLCPEYVPQVQTFIENY